MKLIFKSSKGDEVELYGRPYQLYFVEGLGDVDAENQSIKSPFQDGDSHVDTLLKPRYITIELRITSDARDLTALRRRLSSVLNPKLGLGKLSLITNNGEYEVPAVSERVPYYPDGRTNRKQWFQKAMISLKCPNPYWRSPNQESRPLKSYVGKFKLPMTFPFELGTSGSRTTLYNDGDVPAPVTVEIHGPTTNPQLFNRTTGEHIRINRTIADDEILHVNTQSGRQRVEIERNGELNNAFGYLDHDSSALSDFCLELGENEIEHVADAGNRHAQVIVRWQDQFVGV